MVSKDPAITLGPAGNPTISGATVRLVNPATLEEVTLTLPATGWVGLGNPAGSRGYRYKDLAETCFVARIVPGKLLKAVCKGAGIGFTLGEPSQGFLNATFQSGNDPAHCMAFGGVVKDQPATNGRAGAFVGKGAPAPTACDL